MVLRILALLSLIFFLAACEENTKQNPIYSSMCNSCHNSDPHKDGSLGPALYGTRKDVLSVKVKFGTYPVGYKPKRLTQMMPRFQLSEEQINELFQYLNTETKD